MLAKSASVVCQVQQEPASLQCKYYAKIMFEHQNRPFLQKGPHLQKSSIKSSLAFVTSSHSLLLALKLLKQCCKPLSSNLPSLQEFSCLYLVYHSLKLCLYLACLSLKLCLYLACLSLKLCLYLACLNLKSCLYLAFLSLKPYQYLAFLSLKPSLYLAVSASSHAYI